MIAIYEDGRSGFGDKIVILYQRFNYHRVIPYMVVGSHTPIFWITHTFIQLFINHNYSLLPWQRQNWHCCVHSFRTQTNCCSIFSWFGNSFLIEFFHYFAIHDILFLPCHSSKLMTWWCHSLGHISVITFLKLTHLFLPCNMDILMGK